MEIKYTRFSRRCKAKFVAMLAVMTMVAGCGKNDDVGSVNQKIGAVVVAETTVNQVCKQSENAKRISTSSSDCVGLVDGYKPQVTASDGVQLWEGGPYWAECNVGAAKPEDPGYYFWWGDTVGYKWDLNDEKWISARDLSMFIFSEKNCLTYEQDVEVLQSNSYIDSTGNLVSAHDAATVYLGAPWRLPTNDEIDALVHNCDSIWTIQGGKKGTLFKGRGDYASKSIFLPATGFGNPSFLYRFGKEGYYWSSTPIWNNIENAFCLWSHSSSPVSEHFHRFAGMTVRPVR